MKKKRHKKNIQNLSPFWNFSVRGRLSSIPLVMRNTGVLIAYVLGATIDYFTIPLICVIIPIVFVINFTFLPNTPRFHLGHGHIRVCNLCIFIEIYQFN